MDPCRDLTSSTKRLQWEPCQLARKECSAMNVPPPPGAPGARPPPHDTCFPLHDLSLVQIRCCSNMRSRSSERLGRQ